MGIPGLTTYISKNVGIFYNEHSLHDTMLLIDGNSLASQIYLTLTVTNSAFGGDYERFRHSVEKFMKLLLSCNILPIVVFDGGYEIRKLKTTVSRLKTTIIGVSSFKSVNQQNNVKLFPMFMKEVFKQVSRDLHIPCVQSDLEADFDLVYLGRLFQCPILSYDSDFYLNDVEYIPFFNLELKGGKECEASSTRKALSCKIYRVEHLLRHFGGLSKDFIPLLQCMLGNDYISHIHFKSFLAQLNFRFSSGRKSPVSKRLAVLIKWCRCQRSLESALEKIIENLKYNRKSEAIKLVKRSILDYKTEECILYPYVMEQIVKYNLSAKLEELLQIKKSSEKTDYYACEPIKMTIKDRIDSESDDETSDVEDESVDTNEDGTNREDEIINMQGVEDELSGHQERPNACDSNEERAENQEQEETESDESGSIENSSGSEKEEKSMNSTKSAKKFNSNYLSMTWLVDEFRHGNLSTHIANMINLCSIYLLPLRENIKLDSVHVASYPMLKSLGNLLLGNFHSNAVLRVYTREMGKMKVVRLRCNMEDDDLCDDAGCRVVPVTKEACHEIRDNVTDSKSTTDEHSGDDRKHEKMRPGQNIELSVNENVEKINKNTKPDSSGHQIDDSPSDNSKSSYKCLVQDMPKYDLTFRRRLLLNYLQLSHLDPELFNGDIFPQDWNLFFISIIYWCNHSEHVNCYHVKCLVIGFIFLNIVQSRCGYFESTSSFNRKYAKKLNAVKIEIQNEKIERKKSKKSAKKKDDKENQIANGDDTNLLQDDVEKLKNNKVNGCVENRHQSSTFNSESTVYENNNANLDKRNLHSSSILKIIDTNKINMNQLILLYEQFLQLSHLDERLRSNHTCFNKDVIHVLCEYQSVLYVMNMFNSILKFPFQELDMSKIYSGTFLYNLYCKIFNKDNCIPLLFEHCDDMFEVYRFMANLIEDHTETNVFKVNRKKVKRKKKKKEKAREKESEGEEKPSEGEEETLLIDSDNIYSLLQDVCI